MAAPGFSGGLNTEVGRGTADFKSRNPVDSR
jgi:hypothetical protein